MLTFFPTTENLVAGFILLVVLVALPSALLLGAYCGILWVKKNFFFSPAESKHSLFFAAKVVGAVLAAYIVVGNIGRISGVQINSAQAVENK